MKKYFIEGDKLGYTRYKVDGVKNYAEAQFFSYTHENDMNARERITAYFKEKENATGVVFDSSYEEVEKLHL